MMRKKPRLSRRMGRRTFVKGAIASTGALATAGYVKPELRALGVSRARAVSPGGEDPEPTPTPSPTKPDTSHACSLNVSLTASGRACKITGQVCITNESDDGESCKISKVHVLIEPRMPFGGFGQGCGKPWICLVYRSNTGGPNALCPGTVIPGPLGTETCFTLVVESIVIRDIGRGDDFKVHVIVEYGPHHIHGTKYAKACSSVTV